MRLAFSDELSAGEKRAHDTQFNAHGYRSLQSKFFVHSELANVSKAGEIVLAKAKLLPIMNQR